MPYRSHIYAMLETTAPGAFQDVHPLALALLETNLLVPKWRLDGERCRRTWDFLNGNWDILVRESPLIDSLWNGRTQSCSLWNVYMNLWNGGVGLGWLPNNTLRDLWEIFHHSSIFEMKMMKR